MEELEVEMDLMEAYASSGPGAIVGSVKGDVIGQVHQKASQTLTRLALVVARNRRVDRATTFHL